MQLILEGNSKSNVIYSLVSRNTMFNYLYKKNRQFHISAITHFYVSRNSVKEVKVAA